jgi:hypothetical protein
MLTLPPACGGRGRGVASVIDLGAAFREPPPSWGIGLEIWRGALMVGLPFRAVPDRREILLLSSDILPF